MKQLIVKHKGKPKICTCSHEFGIHDETCLVYTHTKTDYFKWGQHKASRV